MQRRGMCRNARERCVSRLVIRKEYMQSRLTVRHTDGILQAMLEAARKQRQDRREGRIVVMRDLARWWSLGFGGGVSPASTHILYIVLYTTRRLCILELLNTPTYNAPDQLPFTEHVTNAYSARARHTQCGPATSRPSKLWDLFVDQAALVNPFSNTQQ